MRKVPFTALIFPLSSLLLFTCGSARKNGAPDLAVGTVRYLEDTQTMQVQVEIKDSDTLRTLSAPKIFNFEMKQLPQPAAGRYAYNKPMNYPSVIPLDLPCGGSRCTVDLSFAPIFIDSFPTSISRKAKLSVPISHQALKERESLIFFFEPSDRSAPKRIQLLGPTDRPIVTLPKDAVATIPVGEYEVYLIKQELQRDSTEQLITSMQLEYITRARKVTITE